MLNDLRGKAALVTGGTRGIGLATGLALGRQGAVCTLTHKWGSADDDEVRAAFAAANAPPPHILEADAAEPEDTTRLLEAMRARHEAVEVFVSNVALAPVVRSLDDYVLRSLLRSIEYTAWPMVDYTQKIRAIFGRYPRYVVGLSSAGPDIYHASYDFVAAAKSVLETLCRYMGHRLFEEDVRINVVRARHVRTDSLRATFGPDVEPFLEQHGGSHAFITPEEVANAVLGLCSGLMDGVSGQVLLVDHGGYFADDLMRHYDDDRRRAAKETPSTPEKA